MLLIFLGSRMQLKFIAMLFGVVQSTVSNTIHEMIPRVVEQLKKHPLAKIKFPNERKKRKLAEMVSRREPSVENIIGFVDGLVLQVQCNEEEQEAYYNGYQKTTTCNNVITFSPEGKIIHASINYPGSWHDSAVSAESLMETVIARIGDYALCVDQGFKKTGDMKGKFVGAISRRRKRKICESEESFLEHYDELEKSDVHTSLRQAAEWGMRALQATFSRLTCRLTSDHSFRGDLILCVFLLHNFRTELIGGNQIATVFDHEYEQYVNVEGYDRISRYFQF